MTQLIWFVTGCSSGVGEILIRQILARGDRVIATARNFDSIMHLGELGVATLRLDVTDDEKTVNEVITKAVSIYGRIDVLVNNAGYIAAGTWEDLDYEHFKAQFDVNVFGVIKVTRALLPHFRQRRSGTVVHIGSRSGWYGDPYVGAYAGSKFALEGLAEALWRETEHLGIKNMIIDLGRHRTMLLSDEKLKFVPSEIDDYKEESIRRRAGLAKEDRTQPGDPEKAVSVILDLIRKEGCAAGREIPFRMPLGVDTYETMKERSEETLHLLEEWGPVILSSNSPILNEI